MKPHLTNAIGKLRLCSWVGWSSFLILCIVLILSRPMYVYAQNDNCDPGYHYNAATGNCDPDTPAASDWWNSLNDGTKGVLMFLGLIGVLWIFTQLGAPTLSTFTFNASSFPGFYDASNDKSKAYNIAAIVKDKQNMWSSYGALFKKVGSELGMDPYALAAYCVFESYSSDKHNFNTRMVEHEGGMCAAGIAATQAQDVMGTKVPGLNISLPNSTFKAAETLRANPEYGIRYLAKEFKGYYSKEKDLAKAFPKVAYPNWKDPNKSLGNYGTQAQYVSRAFVFYNAFRAADNK